jgi:hypothetical protein
MKSKYSISVIASVLIVTMALYSFMPVMAQVPVIGPKLDVKTVAQDDQMRKTGVIVLGMIPTKPWPSDKGYSQGQKLFSEYKLIVSMNGLTIFWSQSGPTSSYPYAGPIITCNVLEKDKVNPVPDKFGVPTAQFPQENLETKLYDVSDKFICKVHWKQPAGMPGMYESVGVLDVYYVGPVIGTVIADNILSVEASWVIGTVVVMGTDMQDICVLGWSMATNDLFVTLPDGHPGNEPQWISTDALNKFAGCDAAALVQRDYLGIEPAAVTTG